ncbi:Gfo/Idh/MocA family oxidoreductase [Arcobacteraceae bacterium]|nr:Gfo/Idh/MocA family oxidoreductase [Arcobacteraceae bacterium]
MIKIGIAGFGKMGQIRANEVLKNKDTNLIAVFEQYDEISDIKYDNLIHCKTYEELLEQDLDAIFICAFNDVAASFTIEALKREIHVFCEKPPAKEVKELEEVLNAERESNKVLKYGFNHRLHYSVIEAKKLIDTGSMGRLLWIRGVYGKAGSIDYNKNWRNYKKYSGGGILLDQGIHMLDLMCYFTSSEFEVLNAKLTNSFWDIEVEDNAFITMQNDDNVVATMHSSATQWKHKFLLEMEFEDGYINLDGILSNSRSYAPEMLITARREFEDVTYAMGKPKEQITWFENDDSWKLELNEFVDAILNSKKVKHGTSHDGMRALSLVEDIYKKSGFYDK